MVLVKRDPVELGEQSELLRSGAWLKSTVQQQRELIARFCEGYVLPPLSVRASTAYRAQVNEYGKLFPHVRRLLAPPAAVVTKSGRLNRAGAPTLYLAGTPTAAIGETRAAVGAVVSVMACHVPPDKPTFQLAPVAMTRLHGDRRLGPVGALRAAGPLGIPSFVASLRERDCYDQWLLQDQTLGELLVTDLPGDEQQALYELTNAIREHLYATWPEYQGVEYPSIVAGLTAPNIALDALRWDDIKPAEVWVVHAGLVLDHYPSGLTTTARPLLALGVVEDDGGITYRSTHKTFLEAAHDFKQRHGFLASSEEFAEPMLQRPWLRHRISYGSFSDRSVFDFFPK